MSSGPASRFQAWLPPTAAASGLVVIFLSVLAIPLSAAAELGISERETVGWIMALYGLPGLLTIILVARYRQPLLLTGNVFFLIFVASLGGEIAWGELVGSAMVAGGLIIIASAIGLAGWFQRWLPPPIVYGVLAGAVLPFLVELFGALGDEPILVGMTLISYLVARRLFEPTIPALLPALLVGIVVTFVAGETASFPADIELRPSFVAPRLSFEALVTVTPVMVALVTVQANVPSMVFLRSQSFEPPPQVINSLSGVATSVASLLGPTGVSLSLPATALCAGPDAGDRRYRHRSAYIAGGALLLIGVLAGGAAALAQVLPAALLAAFVGLAVVGILGAALEQVTTGPLKVGPLFAFAIAQSRLELLDLGPFFWALAGGLLASYWLEREGWKTLATGRDS